MTFLIVLTAFIVRQKYNRYISTTNTDWLCKGLEVYESKLPQAIRSNPDYLLSTILLIPLAVFFLLAVAESSGMVAVEGFIQFMVVFCCLGYGDLSSSVDRYLDFKSNRQTKEGMKFLKKSGFELDKVRDQYASSSFSVVGLAYLDLTFRYYFMLIFWFALTDATGVLVVSLLQALAKRDLGGKGRAKELVGFSSWLPARMLGYTFILVTRFQEAGGYLKELNSKVRDSNEIFLLDSMKRACSELAKAISIQGYERGEEKAQLTVLRALLNRALIAWFSLIGIVTLIGYL